MHPINSKFFGDSADGNWGIKVSLHDGSNAVDGYIVKQLSVKKFIVSDGSTEYVRELSQDGNVDEGKFTIIIKKIVNYSSGGQTDEHVAKFISGRKVKTVEGNTYIFALNTSPYYPFVPTVDPGNYGGITPYI
jgi:hypothetical protein